jgi:HTH-type transcriptional regulator, glycine betaine synthesis regulator
MVARLTELEKESIDYFVSFVQLFGLPKSVGQIYGLMFVSPAPLTMDHLIERLDISKGSASQGLATLRGLGAIVPTSVGGDRREFYHADLQVSRIVNHFLDKRLEPRLENGEVRLLKMIEIVNQESPEEGDLILNRLHALNKWHTRGSRVIPLIKRLVRAIRN